MLGFRVAIKCPKNPKNAFLRSGRQREENKSQNQRTTGSGVKKKKNRIQEQLLVPLVLKTLKNRRFSIKNRKTNWQFYGSGWVFDLSTLYENCGDRPELGLWVF
jgi:hypothetical protein